MTTPRATTGRFVAGLVGLFVCSTMAWLLLWAAAASLLHGAAPVVVATGSMGPSVRAGDLVVLEPYHSQDLDAGMVIRFDDPDGRGSVIHRIVEIDEDGTLTTKGDANAVVDSSAVDAGRITGVGRLLVPRTGLPVLWWRTGDWLPLAAFLTVLLGALAVTRFALLEAHDPWRSGGDLPPRPPLGTAVRGSLTGARTALALHGAFGSGRRLVAQRGAELTALGLAVVFLFSSSTAWAAYRDTTANTGSSFGASSLAPPTALDVGDGGCSAAPNITLRGTATGTAPNGDTGSITIPTPSGVAAGDVLVAHVVVHTHGLNADPLPAPAGWSAVRVDKDGQHVTSGIFWREVTGSVPASSTFTNASGDTTQQAVGAIIAYRGVDTDDPISDDDGAVDVSGSDVLTSPSVTANKAGSRLLTFVGAFGNGQGPATPPAGMNERYEATQVSEISVIEILGQAADATLASPGATGSRTTTVPSTDTSVAQALVLRPFTGSPSADLTWTPSSSPGVDGYLVQRRIGGVLDASATVTPGTASSFTDGPLVDGTTYTYRVIATAGTWRSPPATDTFTPTSC